MSKIAAHTVREAKKVFPLGVSLHARPAALLVKLAQRFESDILIECERKRANAKSILSVLTLCADEGMDLRITARGQDATEAIAAIAELVALLREETNVLLATRKDAPGSCFAQAG